MTVDGTPVTLGGARLRTLVAVLAVSAGESVSIETLADRVWGENLPEQIRQSLHAMVFRLRRAVGADVVQTAGTSYRLTVPPDHVDVLRFERALRTANDPDAITAALGAWTERPFLGTESDWLITTVLPRLEELRLGAIERRADLVDQPSTELIAELRQLTGDHPLRESLWIRLLRSLVRAGRPAEALGLYDVIRSRLADELGVGPGPELQALHAELLAADSVLHVASGPPDEPADELTVPRSLPADAADFVGREREVRLLTTFDGPLIAAIDGMAGVGKTALAMRVAHRLAARYPDGQVYVDLHGHSEGARPVTAAEALGRLLQAFGVPQRRHPQDLEDRAGLLRSLLARRRVLIVLDNAAGEAQVRPLLPGTPGSGVILTSRLRLTGLDPTVAVSLGTLPPPSAVELFTRIAGRRVADAPEAVLAAIADACGHLPLALRICAARLRTHPSWRAEDLLNRLRHHDRRLTELTSGPRSVATAIDLSYRELDDHLRRCYRLLGLHPGADFRAWSAAPLLGLDVATTTGILERLLEVHLLDEPVPGRYRFHDLVRDHAVQTAENVEPAGERRTALARLVEHYCQSASEAAALHAPEHTFASHGLPPIISTPEAAADWLREEVPTTLLITSLTADADRSGCLLHLSAALDWCLRNLGQYDVKVELHRRALTVARAAGDTTAEIDCLIRLGEVLRPAGAYADAIDAFEQARTAARAAGCRTGEVRAIEGAADVHALQDRRATAIAGYTAALAIAEELSDEQVRLDLLKTVGWMHSRCGDSVLSLDYHERALAIAERIRPRSVGKILAGIAHDHLQLGAPERAMDYYERALEHARRTHNRHNELRVLDGLAHVYLELGDLERALRCREPTMALARELNSPNWQFEVHQGFGRIRLALGEPVEALAAHQRALELATGLQQPVDQARAHDGLGDALAALGRCDEALRRWQHALTILEAIGAQTTDELATSIPRLRSKLQGTGRELVDQPRPGPTRVPTK